MSAIFRLKSLIFGLSLVLLAAVLACGEGATPTPTATAQPTPDIAAIVQQALAAQPGLTAADVQSLVEAALAQQPGVTAEDVQQAVVAALQTVPSQEDIQSLVEGAVTQGLAQQPAGLTAQDVQSLVEQAIAATVSPGATLAEVQAAINAAVGAIEPGVTGADVQAAISSALAALPTPTATPVPTPTSVAVVEPSGTLDYGRPNLSPPIWVPRLQSFVTTVFETLTFGESMLAFSDNPTNNVTPRLAESWNLEVAADGTATYTFNIRQGVAFHRNFGLFGEVTADDWVFTIESLGGEASIHSQLGNARRMFLCDGCELTATDTYTLQVTHPKGLWDMPTRFFTYPISDVGGVHSKRHFDLRGEEQAAREPVSAGPWEVVEYDQGVRARLKAVRDHYRAIPQWDELIWWAIGEESTRLASFLTGQLDTGSFSSDSIQAIKADGDPDVKFINNPGGTIHRLTFAGSQYNLDYKSHVPDAEGVVAVPAGDNAFDCSLATISCDRDITSAEWATARKVREAMNLAIDRDALVANLAFGAGNPVFCMHCSGFEDTLSPFIDISQITYDFDPGRARALLAEAGFADGFEIDMWIATLSGGQIPPMQATAQMWRDNLGLTVNETIMPYGAFRPNLVNRTAKGIWMWSFGPSTLEPTSSFGLNWNGNVGINSGVEHPFLQERIDKALNELDPNTRLGLVAEMVQFVFVERLGIPLFSQLSLFPLGPEADVWPLAGTGNQADLSNWERVPHR